MTGKYDKRKQAPASKKIWVVPLLLALGVVIALAGLAVFSGKNSESNVLNATQAYSANMEASVPESAEETIATETTEPDDNLPYTLADGKIIIDSVFQYSGANPDCAWEEGSDIGAVVLRNVSDEYLELVNLDVTMSDGVVLQFTVSDVPAGGTVWAFECNNTCYDAVSIISDVQYETEFLSGTGLVPDQVTLSVSGIDVKLTNVSETDLQGIEVHCRTTLDQVYFGGKSYVYSVETIAAGAEASVVAFDCFLGEAEVTLVDYAD